MISIRSCLQVACVVLGATAALSAQRAEERTLRRAFATSDAPQEAAGRRAAAIEAVRGDDRPEIVEALCAAWVRCDAELRPLEQSLSERMRRGGARLATRERADFDVLLRHCMAIEVALLAFERPDSVQRLVELTVLSGDLPAPLRRAVVGRAAGLAAEQVKRVVAALRDARRPDDAWLAMAALAACGPRVNAAAGEPVAARLGDRVEMVRVQAARCVVALEHRAAVGAWIERLDQEEGRARRLLIDLLEEFTGETLGTASASWRAWWQAEGEHFVTVGRRGGRAESDARNESRTTSGSFFGVPQDGRSVLYVLDRSKSMQQSMAAAGRRPEDGEVSRWQALLDEMERALGQLQPDQQFNILTFGDDNTIWSERLEAARPAKVTAAFGWLREQKLQLGTNVFGALDAAFGMAAPRHEERYFEPGIDTILLLSDGLPTRRDAETPRKLGSDDKDLLLAVSRRRNPFGVVVLHTVALGKGSAGKFLRELAALHGGECHIER